MWQDPGSFLAKVAFTIDGWAKLCAPHSPTWTVYLCLSHEEIVVVYTAKCCFFAGAKAGGGGYHILFTLFFFLLTT